MERGKDVGICWRFTRVGGRQRGSTEKCVYGWICWSRRSFGRVRYFFQHVSVNLQSNFKLKDTFIVFIVVIIIIVIINTIFFKFITIFFIPVGGWKYFSSNFFPRSLQRLFFSSCILLQSLFELRQRLWFFINEKLDHCQKFCWKLHTYY